VQNIAPSHPAASDGSTVPGPDPSKDMQSADPAPQAVRGSKKARANQSKFLAPTKSDPDELKRSNNAKRLSRTSPYAPHVHAAFAQLAAFWNRALFPRIVQASLVANDKRRKQISLCEQRLMAVCVMQHGRNYEVSSLFLNCATFF
jgi:hypothetical protein